MEFSEIRTNVQQWLGNRSDIGDTITDSMINRTYLKYAMAFRFHEIESTDTSLSTTADQAYVDHGITGLYEILALRDTTSELTLKQKDIEWYEDQDDPDETGEPEAFVLWDDGKIYFYPVPDDAYSLRLRYRALPTELSADADEPVLPTDWHPIIEYEAASLLGFQFNMDERAMMLKNMAVSELSTRQEPGSLDKLHIKSRVSPRRRRSD